MGGHPSERQKARGVSPFNFMETAKRLIMKREGIGFFKAVLESYEDVALLTVLDGRAGEVELIYPSEAAGTVASIMDDMRRFGIVFREAGNV